MKLFLMFGSGMSNFGGGGKGSQTLLRSTSPAACVKITTRGIYDRLHYYYYYYLIFRSV